MDNDQFNDKQTSLKEQMLGYKYKISIHSDFLGVSVFLYPVVRDGNFSLIPL